MSSSCDGNTILQLDQQLAVLAQTACTGSTSSSSFLSSCCIPVLQLEIQINNAISGCPGYSSYASQMNTIISEMKSLCKPDCSQSIPKTSYAVCTAMGDPHFIKFDRSYITYTQSGTITLIDNDYFSVIGTAAVRSPFTVPGFTSITVTYKHLCNMQQLTWTGNSVPTLESSTFGDVGIHTLQISSGLTMSAISSMVTIDSSGPYMSVTIFTAVGGSGACGSIAKPASLSSGVVASTFTPETINSMVVQVENVNSNALYSCKAAGMTGDFATACGYDYQASNMNSSIITGFSNAYTTDQTLYNDVVKGNDPTGSSGMGGGGISGIVIGLLAVIFALILIAIKRRKQLAAQAKNSAAEGPGSAPIKMNTPIPVTIVQSAPPQYTSNPSMGAYPPQTMQQTMPPMVSGGYNQQPVQFQQPPRVQTPVEYQNQVYGNDRGSKMQPINQGLTPTAPQPGPIYQQSIPVQQRPMSGPITNTMSNTRRKSIETLALELNIPGLLKAADVPIEQILVMKYNELQPKLGIDVTPEQYLKLKAYKKELGL